jgi:DNA-binding response OmpR family regulator
MSTRTALIVGDNHSLYIHISNLFQQHGCQCKIALNGGLSTDQLLTIKPDFLILDLPLRSSPAMQTAKQIGETLKQMRTRAMIMAPGALLQRHDLKFADVHLAKPFSPKEAETAVQKLVNANRVSPFAPTLSDTHVRP